MDNYYVMEMFSVFSVSAAPLPVPGTGCGAAIFSISGYAVSPTRSSCGNYSMSSMLVELIVKTYKNAVH